MNAAQAVESKLALEVPGASATNVIRVETLMRGGAIVVTVADTGIGIDERALPRIFDPFFKSNTSGGGAGLGLAIANDLVRRVGGEIRVESRPAHGTTFEVVLPLGPSVHASDAPASTSHDVPEAVAKAPVASEGESMLRVLIIDDERALLRALARQLCDRYEVETASTARDALAQLSVHAYEAIVCDLRMPDQSGPQIYDQVAAHSSEQAARFIFTTGGSYGSMDDQLHERAVATGLPVLEKPFDGVSFEVAIARVVSRLGRISGAGGVGLLEARAGGHGVAHGGQFERVAGPGGEQHAVGHEPLAEVSGGQVRNHDDASTDQRLRGERLSQASDDDPRRLLSEFDI
jgi:CheY-like chemotaxis protein